LKKLGLRLKFLR